MSEGAASVGVKLSVPRLLINLWNRFGGRRRKQVGLLLVLMVVASFAEMISIGAVLPFLGMFTAGDLVFAHPAAQPFIKWFNVADKSGLLLLLTLLFCASILIAGFIRLLLLWASTKFSFSVGADLGIDIYRRTLYQPYVVHVSRNSSEVIAGISVKTNTVINYAVMPMLMLVSSSIMLTAILCAMLWINAVIALISFAGFALIYAVIVVTVKKKIAADSKKISTESTQVIKSLQEGLGGIRDVLLDGTQSLYCEIYQKADAELKRAQGRSQFISQSPRYAIEAAGMVLIAGLAYYLSQESAGISKAIPVLGGLALGAQRLLPTLQQAYWSWATMQSGAASLRDTLDLLDQPMPQGGIGSKPEPIKFANDICLNQISFRYADQGAWVLNNLGLRIKKGSRIGVIGETGSGKSTLLDIVMGLLQPTKGTLSVDGEVVTALNVGAWQAHIAHVPQNIFLADCSIKENIAFGVPVGEIDFERVKRVAREAQIEKYIATLPSQYDTRVGERGVNLSGGQRQRIGIARALYKQADVLVFDEATSALDNNTEELVMGAVDGLDKDLTVIIIAHRLSTLKQCAEIVEIKQGSVARISSYHGLVV